MTKIKVYFIDYNTNVSLAETKMYLEDLDILKNSDIINYMGTAYKLKNKTVYFGIDSTIDYIALNLKKV